MEFNYWVEYFDEERSDFNFFTGFEEVLIATISTLSEREFAKLPPIWPDTCATGRLMSEAKKRYSII